MGWAVAIMNQHKQVANHDTVFWPACHEYSYAHNKCLVWIDWSPLFRPSMHLKLTNRIGPSSLPALCALESVSCRLSLSLVIDAGASRLIPDLTSTFLDDDGGTCGR